MILCFELISVGLNWLFIVSFMGNACRVTRAGVLVGLDARLC